MKKTLYEVDIIGGRKITITASERDVILQARKTGFLKTVRIGGNELALSSIRGIFEIQTRSFEGINLKTEESFNEFNSELLRLSEQNAKEKSIREMKRRVSPGLKFSGVKQDDQIVQTIYSNILDFHANNARWPWCPVKIWWDMVKPYLQQRYHGSRWYIYVFRHDEQVWKWYTFRYGIPGSFNSSLLTQEVQQ